MTSMKLDSVRSSPGGVGDLIVHAVERHDDRVAFTCGGRSFTYAQFGRHVSQAIRFFESAGLVPDDKVLQLSENSYEMFVLMAACNVGGFVSVTPHCGNSIEDHLYVLDDCEASLVVADGQREQRVVDFAARSKRPFRAFRHGAGGTLPPLWPLLEQMAPAPLRARDEPGDITRLIYTGGTTGQPKGVITLSSQLAFSALLHAQEQCFQVDTRMLAASPISHGAGSFIIPVLFKGGCCVIRNGFDAERILLDMASGEINHAFFVPTMVYALMDHPLAATLDLTRMRRIVYAGSPISLPRLEQALRIFGPVLTQNYGQTEVPGTVLSLTAEEHFDKRANRLTSAGKPYPCVAVKVMDDDVKEVERGKGIVGEICVRAPHATPGYWKKPELTEQLWRGGWLHTGDMAHQDEDGYLHIVDRKKDMIISGGFNIYPKELENALHEHPAVSSVAVVGIPHEKWGETVKAVVVLKEGSVATPQELIDYMKARKGSVMAPKVVEFVASLPLTNLGKVDKKALRAPHWDGQQRAIS